MLRRLTCHPKLRLMLVGYLLILAAALVVHGGHGALAGGWAETGCAPNAPASYAGSLSQDVVGVSQVNCQASNPFEDQALYRRDTLEVLGLQDGQHVWVSFGSDPGYLLASCMLSDVAVTVWPFDQLDILFSFLPSIRANGDWQFCGAVGADPMAVYTPMGALWWPFPPQSTGPGPAGLPGDVLDGAHAAIEQSVGATTGPSTVAVAVSAQGVTAAVIQGTAVFLPISGGQAVTIPAGDSFLFPAPSGEPPRELGTPRFSSQDQARLALINGPRAHATPTMPSSGAATFSGTLMLSGIRLSNAAVLIATINGTPCGTFALNGPSAGLSSALSAAGPLGQQPYRIAVNSASMQPACGKNGDRVSFQIQDGNAVISLLPSGSFQSGASISLNLSPPPSPG